MRSVRTMNTFFADCCFPTHVARNFRSITYHPYTIQGNEPSTRISTVHFHRLSCHVIRQTCVPDTDSSVLGQHHIVYFWDNLVWIDFIGGLQDHETNKFQFSDSRGTDSRKCIKVLGCVSSGPHVSIFSTHVAVQYQRRSVRATQHVRFIDCIHTGDLQQQR